MTFRLVISNKIDEMTQLTPFVEEVSEAFNIASDVVFQLQLALDEALANSVNYAYPEGAVGEISLEAVKADDCVVFTLTDHGTEFDPTKEGNNVDTSLSVEDRPIGGLGIFLIKQMMDDVQYERKDGCNYLRMTKRIRQ